MLVRESQAAVCFRCMNCGVPRRSSAGHGRWFGSGSKTCGSCCAQDISAQCGIHNGRSPDLRFFLSFRWLIIGGVLFQWLVAMVLTIVWWMQDLNGFELYELWSAHHYFQVEVRSGRVYTPYRYYRRYSGIISNRRCILGVRPNAFQIEDIAECKSSSNDQKSKNKPLNIGMIFGISSIWKSFVPLPFFVFFCREII